jgi:NADPH-dependent curcumin reductase CurA
VPIGGTVTALGVGRVLASASDALAPGDAVFGPLGAQSHLLMPAAALRKLDATDVPPRAYLGALGLTTGLTAWAGMVRVGEVHEGNTVVVSAAAGAVGSVACEVARLRGARVIGIAGGPEKVRYLQDDLGCVAGIDYKNEDVAARLSELAADGIDVFFDNVGGENLDLVLDRMATGARIVICGAISQYHDLSAVRGPALYLRLAERNASMRGFTVTHHAEAFAEAEAELGGWLRGGDLHLRETIVEGIERFPEALNMLFTGGHIGKLLLRP